MIGVLVALFLNLSLPSLVNTHIPYCVPTIIIEANPKISPATERTKVDAKFLLKENRHLSWEEAVNIVRTSKQVANKYDNLTKDVLLGLMYVESSYRPSVVSGKGAIGLMQVHAKTWLKKHDNAKDLVSLGIAKTVNDLYSPAKNIAAGAHILNLYILEGISRDYDNPLKYGLTRYFGGSNNNHYEKTMAAINKLKDFRKNYPGDA